MISNTKVFATAAILGAVLALAGASTVPAADGDKPAAGEAVLIDGSTTLLPLVQEVARRFHLESSTRVEVTGSSSTSGLARLLEGSVSIATASRSIKKTEDEAFTKSGDRYVELPVALDAIAVIVHPDNRWIESVTLDDLRRILCDADAQTWDQIRPDAPALALTREVPEEGSGTLGFLLERLGRPALTAAARHNDNHAATLERVAREPGAIGIVSYSYAEKNAERVRALAIDEGDGPVLPSSETLADATYPLGRPLWIYVRESVARRPEIREFVTFLLDEASEVATELGMAPLPEQFLLAAHHRFETSAPGSVMLDGDLTALVQAYLDSRSGS